MGWWAEVLRAAAPHGGGAAVPLTSQGEQGGVTETRPLPWRRGGLTGRKLRRLGFQFTLQRSQLEDSTPGSGQGRVEDCERKCGAQLSQSSRNRKSCVQRPWGGRNASGQGRLRSGPGLPGQVRVYRRGGGWRRAGKQSLRLRHVVAPIFAGEQLGPPFPGGQEMLRTHYTTEPPFPRCLAWNVLSTRPVVELAQGVLSALLGQVPAHRWQRPSCQFKPSPGPGPKATGPAQA